MSALVVNLLLFSRLLRAAGLQVPHARMADAIGALEWIGIDSRSDVRAALRSLLVARHEDLAIFDKAFDLFFRTQDSSGLNLPLFSLDERARVMARRDAGAPARVDLEDTVSDATTGAAFAMGAYSPVEVSRTKDFGEFTATELEGARRLLLQMPWEPGRRRTRRWARARDGAIDLRRLLRRSVMRAEFVDLPRRRARETSRPIILLADVSGSMERYSRIVLHFACGLARSASDVETFLFATRLTRVTRQVTAPGGHRAITRLVQDLHDWGGGTRIGEALRTFNTRWARRVMRHGPVVLIVSDGWDRGDPAVLARELARVRRSCSRLIWLNPLLGSAGYEPLTRGMQAALGHIDDFLPVHNLTTVERLAMHLRAVPSRRHGHHRDV